MRKFEKITKEQWAKDSSVDYDNIILPVRSTSGSAGYDFVSPVKALLMPRRNYLLPTGIKCQMNSDEVLQVFIRSSMAIKNDITLKNHVGIIDSDYFNNPDNEGHIHIALKNESPYPYEIYVGDKIAQGIFIKYLTTDDDNVKNARNGGFGSTGN